MMTSEQEVLWSSIEQFEMDDTGSAWTFTERLAKENAWTIEYALRCTFEYKKFMFLICATDQTLTPSEEVDQVWHLHLLYTRSYWDDFCRDTLRRNIHHGPTKGGKAEHEKFTGLYENTKRLYKQFFGTDPPPDIWPDTETRFREIDFVRVNVNRHWIIHKPSFLS